MIIRHLPNLNPNPNYPRYVTDKPFTLNSLSFSKIGVMQSLKGEGSPITPSSLTSRVDDDTTDSKTEE
jgi:hypothetical protein